MVEVFVLKKGFAGTVKRAQMFLFPTDISGAQISYQNSSRHEAVWAGRDISKLRHLPGEVLRPLQGRQPGSIKVCSAASHICFPLLLMAPHPRLVWLIKRRERMCGQSKLNKWAIKTGGRTTSSRWRALWCLQCVLAKLRAGEDKGLSGMCYNCGPSTERCLWLPLRGNLMSGIGRGANKPLMALHVVSWQVLTESGFGAITTEIREAPEFYYAEDYHQQYLSKNPDGYCGLGGTGISCPIGIKK